MPAVSKAQQRFMGMVYATKKGDMTNPSPEVAQAAASMKKSDAKDFASTKHKKLPEKKVAKEAADFSQRDKIMKRAKPLHKHLFKNLHKGDRKGDVNERVDYDDSKQMKKYADEKKKHKEQDKRMKFGKFYKRAEDSRERLRPGEVKRYDKAKGKWVSNKD
jgi:hypothetical protein